MPDTKRRTILCVDDEPDVVDSLADTFMHLFDVKTANSGKEALKIFMKEDIPLVITDQRMPEMEGSELLAKINSIKPICKKILLTGYSDINAAIDAINSGSVDKYLSKPWDDDELIRVVEGLLEDIATDEFIARMTGDVKNFKEKMKDAAVSSKLYGRFLENYAAGICLAEENETIAYINKAGLKLLGFKDLDGVKGRPLGDVFSIEACREQCRILHKNRDLTPAGMTAKPAKGKAATVQASIVFAETGEILGLVFGK